MINVFGQKVGHHVVHTAEQQVIYDIWERDLKDGTMTHSTHKIWRPPKTHQQVKTHFGLAVMMIRQRMIDLGLSIFGVEPNKDMVHEILTRTCAGVGGGGTIVRLSDQTVTETMQFFENIRDFAAKQLHLVIPDPDIHWKESQLHQE